MCTRRERAELGVLFSPDGRSVAVMMDLDEVIQLWNLSTRLVRMRFHHQSALSSCAFSPDGRWLAAPGQVDPSLVVWDVESGTRRMLLEDGPGHTPAIAFSPDGTPSIACWARGELVWGSAAQAWPVLTTPLALCYRLVLCQEKRVWPLAARFIMF
jgi:WD40 repeat protein